MAKQRAVVVGAGGISNAWFGPLLQEKIAIEAVVDLNRSAAAGQIEKYELDAEACDDLDAALKAHRPDIVVDLTIPDAHCEVTCKALKAGAHVIGEKPMASSMAEARKMVRTAEQAGKVYMVSQNRRAVGTHERARRTAAKLGELTTLNCDFYIGAHFGGFRDQMPSPLILDMAIHHFDLARFLTGKDPLAVYAHEFNSALRTGKTPATECHDNIKSLAMVFAAIESSKKRKRVEVKV